MGEVAPGACALGLSASISLLLLLWAEPFVSCCTSVLLSGPGLGGCPASGTEEMWVTMYQIAGSLLAIHQLLEAHGAHMGLCLQKECTHCSCAAASPGE